MDFAVRNTRYRTSDGGADYVFDFEHHPGSWRIYIVDQPPYGGRHEGTIETHRLTDAGRRYICWDRPVPTLDDAKGIAAMWADATQEYVRSGRFGASADRSHVYDWSTSSDSSGMPGTPARAVPPSPPPDPPRAARSPAVQLAARDGRMRRFFRLFSE